MGQLDGKVSIITGGGFRIGKGIARAFGREGAAVVIASRNRHNLESTAEELRSQGATVEVVPTDVTDEAQVTALFDHTTGKFGRLDILVNNAGALESGPLEELSLAQWQKVMDVNLTGVFLCTREAMKIMKRQRGGRIINIGALPAQMPQMNWAPYVTSKHGLVGPTKSTALKGRAFGVVASCLHPGVVADKRSDSAQITPDDVAKVAVTVATLPHYANMLESIVMPVAQPYLGRG